MGIKLQLPSLTELRPRITVIGVGGAGGNAINNMIASGLRGVDFIAANTDAQALASSSAEDCIQLGVNLTEGLGAGSRPEIGEAAAEEAVEDIRNRIAGSHMVFVAAGMGGGTGTGAISVIARTAKELGILTVGVVTKPFHFEGTRRMRIADAGVSELRRHVDTLIVIPNQNLFRIANDKTTFAEAFLLADQVLHSGIACITDLILKEGLINLDFADVRTVMSGMGTAMMGTGEAGGERRALDAAELAIQNPLLDDVSLRGAKGLLISISGNRGMTLYEVDEAASRVRQEVDPEANIIVGATFDETIEDRLRVSIVAAGLAIEAGRQPARAPAPARSEATVPTAPTGEVRRRLSEALTGTGEPRRPPEPRREPSAAAAAPYSEPAVEPEPEPASAWQGSGDVVIELGVPHLQSPAPLAPLAEWQPEAEAAPRAAEPPFLPQPPADLRRPVRRLPEVGDFPPVGQKEYLAKRAPQPEPPSVEKRRTGLFARLTGRGRESEDAPSLQHEAPPADARGAAGSTSGRGRPDDGVGQSGRDRPVFIPHAEPKGSHEGGGRQGAGGYAQRPETLDNSGASRGRIR